MPLISVPVLFPSYGQLTVTQFVFYFQSPEKLDTAHPYNPMLAESFAFGVVILETLLGKDGLNRLIDEGNKGGPTTIGDVANLHVHQLGLLDKIRPIHRVMKKMLMPEKKRITITQMINELTDSEIEG